MNKPRVTISMLIAVVAIAALNFGAIRVLAGLIETADWAISLGLGALPMANVLAVIILIGGRNLGSRPFLMGFVSFGAMALVLYVGLACFFTDALLSPYLDPVIVPIQGTIGHERPFLLVPILFTVAIVMLGLPQLVFALIGGVLSRRYIVTVRIAKRPAPKFRETIGTGVGVVGVPIGRGFD